MKSVKLTSLFFTLTILYLYPLFSRLRQPHLTKIPDELITFILIPIYHECMRRNGGAVRYAAGTATSRVGLVNMYIYGGSILSLFTLIMGFVSTGTIAGAIDVLIRFYIMRLSPWPLGELLLAETVIELVVSNGITISVGLMFATSKWWTRV